MNNPFDGSAPLVIGGGPHVPAEHAPLSVRSLASRPARPQDGQSRVSAMLRRSSSGRIALLNAKRYSCAPRGSTPPPQPRLRASDVANRGPAMPSIRQLLINE